MNRGNMVPVISLEALNEMVSDLAQRINHDYAGRSLVLVCPLKGSCFFAADFMRQLQIDVEVDFVYLRSFAKGSPRILKDISVDVRDRHVLIVEEIIDAGKNLDFLKTRLLAASPASLKVMTLLNRTSRREVPIQPDYVGCVIDDRFVVGYGMDIGELGRNYPCIYNLSQ